MRRPAHRARAARDFAFEPERLRGVAQARRSGPDLNCGNWATRPALGRYSRPMSEAKPDPSGSTGEFRAFVERAAADSGRRAGLRNPVLIGAVALVALIVIVVLALAVR